MKIFAATGFRSFRLAFGMFSRIPVGKPEWSESAQKYILLFFPLVGVVIGALEFCWLLLSSKLVLPALIKALGMTLIPAAVSGGIHLDGLADTSDALASNSSPERRREILKDPHTGAFGVIGVAVWFLCYYSFAASFPVYYSSGFPVLFGAGFVFSRILSATLSLSLNSGTDGYVRAFRSTKGSAVITVLIICQAAIAAAVIALWEPISHTRAYHLPAALIIIQYILLAYLCIMAKQKFGGMSGDLAGWFLCVSEVLWLGTLTVGGGYIYA